MTLVQNIKDAYNSETVDQEAAAGLVEYLLITAVVAVAALLFIGWLMTAVGNKTADTADCIEGSSSWDPNKSAENCKNTDHSKNNSFKKDSGYQSRYGNG